MIYKLLHLQSVLGNCKLHCRDRFIFYQSMEDFNSSVYQVIGEKIKARRIENNLKQSDLADLLGLNRVSISNIESGRHQVSLATIYKIASILNTDISEILPTAKEIETFINNRPPSLLDQMKMHLSLNSIEAILA